MMFNLKHFFTQNENMQTNFTIPLTGLELIEPFKSELNIRDSTDSAFLMYDIANSMVGEGVDFEIVDSDVLVEEKKEPLQANTSILDLLECQVYNKSVS